MYPYLYQFELGSQTVSLATYTVLSVLGIVLAGGVHFLLLRDARERPFAHLMMIGTLVIVAAVASRVTQILLDLRLAQELNLSFFDLIEQSGSNIIGGIVAGGAVILLFAWRDPNRIMTAKSVDALAVAFPLGHMVGRLGCLSAGCCFGVLCPSPSPLTITYPDNWIVAEISELSIPHGPRIAAPLIAAVALFLIGLTLFLVFRFTRSRGQIAPLYLMLYGPFRFFHDYVRGDRILKGVWGPFTTGQWFGIFAFIIGTMMLARFFVRYRRGGCRPPFLTLNGQELGKRDAFETGERIGG